MADQADTGFTEVVLAPASLFEKVVFSREDYIGRGELSLVYRGTAVEAGDVVVKVPHSPLKAEEVRREYAVLAGMRQRLPPDQPLPIPQAALGEVDSLPVMVIPYYHPQQLLVTHVRRRLKDGQALEAERLAVRAGLSFARAMQALHSLDTPYCCTDRKIKDFYVLDNGSVIVIDWNVLRPFNQEFRLGEIRLFGYLWHELFLERKGSPPFDPFTDMRWRPAGALLEQGGLSVGLRWLLARAVDYQPAQDADYFTALEKALRVWDDLIAPDAGDVRERDMRHALSLFPPAQPQPPADDEIEAALADLRWRLLQDGLEERTIALRKARPGQALSQEIADEFERDPVRAQTIVQREIETAEARRDWILWAHMQRWQRLINISAHADLLNRDGKIRARDKTDIERREVLIGRALHTQLDAEDPGALERAHTAIEEIRHFHAELNTPDLRQIETEIMLRSEARAFNHEDTLSSLTQHLNRIESRLRLDGDHYLSRPPGSAEGDLTLLEQIVRHYLVADLASAVNTLSPEVGSAAVYRLYYAALAAADLEAEGRWLQATLQPLVDLVEFVVHSYQVAADPDEARLDMLFSRAQEFYTRFTDASPVENWKNVVADALTACVRAVAKRLAEALVVPSLAGIMRVEPLYRALANYHDLLVIKLTLPFDNSVDRYQNIYTFCTEWLDALERFRQQPTLNRLRALLEKLADPKRGKVPMTDLFGLDFIDKYRTDLETVIQQDLELHLKTFLNQVSQFKNQVAAKQTEVHGQMDSLERDLQQYRHLVSDLVAQVRGELDALKAQQLEIQARQALERLDVKALEQYVQYQPALRPELEAIKALENNASVRSRLNTLQQHISLNGFSTLELLYDLRDRLRKGTLPRIDSYEVELFFTDSTLHDIARRNNVLQNILDLYWVARVNQLRANSARSLSEIIHDLAGRAGEARRQLNELHTLFARGENKQVREILEQITASSETLTDELLRQVVYSWHDRLTANETALVQLNRVNNRLKPHLVTLAPDLGEQNPLKRVNKEPSGFSEKGRGADNDPATQLTTIRALLQDVQEIVVECPPSAYTQHLHDQWLKTLLNIQFLIDDFKNDLKEMRLGRQRSDWEKQIAELEELKRRIVRHAERKLDEHDHIFGVKRQKFYEPDRSSR